MLLTHIQQLTTQYSTLYNNNNTQQHSVQQQQHTVQHRTNVSMREGRVEDVPRRVKTPMIGKRGIGVNDGLRHGERPACGDGAHPQHIIPTPSPLASPVPKTKTVEVLTRTNVVNSHSAVDNTRQDSVCTRGHSVWHSVQMGVEVSSTS